VDWQPIPEARLERSAQDELVPTSAGWFVVNVADARGVTGEELGSAALFEGSHEDGSGFEEFGLNIQVLDPGQPNCMYHRENQQEGYLVLFGECLLIRRAPPTSASAPATARARCSWSAPGKARTRRSSTR
jgi:hypothetical protein